MDQKGYVMSGLAFLLILPAILLVAVFVDMTTMGGQSISLVMQSDTTFYAAKDMERNVPLISSQVIKEVALNVTTTGNKLPDSKSLIKNTLQARMDTIAQKMKSSIGADDVSFTVLSVSPSTNPFLIEINSTIYVKKGTSVHNDTISQDINLKGLPDPLPFIKCKEANVPLPILDNSTGKISYGHSLAQYLQQRGVANYTVYENATSQGYLVPCGFEPYDSTTDGHGVNATSTEIPNLKLCLNTGYYHESSDGACYLCRLEGKATCSHYGIETFIVPAAANNGTLIFAPVSIDHVIFDSTNTYSGKALLYQVSSGKYYKLYLDNGHRLKYGLITY